MTDRELMQQALEGLEAAYEGQIWLSHLPDLSTALRDRLAQPEQEPVGEVSGYDYGIGLLYRDLQPGAPLYAAPPQRKPLTDEEIDKLPWEPHEGNPMTFAEGLRYFARAVEAKLKEKNT